MKVYRLVFAATAAVALFGATAVGRTAHAQSVPWPNQALLLMRVLAYDRNLAARAGDSPVIAIVFDAGDESSKRARSGIVAAFEKVAASRTVGGGATKLVSLAYGGDFERELSRSGATAVYLCPGLNGAVSAITRTTQKHKALTLTGERAYVEAGASIGVVPEGGKAKILVNLKSTRNEGADLPAAFLRVAEVLQ